MSDPTLNFEPIRRIHQGYPWCGIFDVLDEYLRPGSEKTPDIAAVQIHRYNPTIGNGKKWDYADCEQFLWDFWEKFIEFARAIPHNHPSQERLVNLVIQLTRVEGQKTIIITQQRKCRFWADLPRLEECMGEVRAPPRADQLSEFGESARKYINWNSFAARMHSTGLVDWEIYGLWAFRDALENTISGKPVVNCYVTAATEWVAHGGKALFRCFSDGPLDDETVHLTGNGHLYWGRTGLSLERWRFWKRRFQEIGERVDEDVKRKAIAAIGKMNEIEGEC
ncbi:hypothetical protein GP486_004104 [Trichoglossum hirsutum]|uniref:Uncharacterized protein n=1 Tax=Trichoglossum hirsutum TaxID=265104 RepID=A0A9P8RQ85_9PEZI|nr:hypothetical protein GP486_004104 [Trichoglossum hirsutum]